MLIELEIERLSARRISMDGADRVAGEDPGDVVAVVGAEVAPIPVPREKVVVVAESSADDRPPVAPPRSHVDGTVDEARVAVQELADVDRVVPGLLQPDWQDIVLVDERGIAPAVRKHPVVVRVLSREQRCARRAALGSGGDVIAEPGAAPGEETHRPRHDLAVELTSRL